MGQRVFASIGITGMSGCGAGACSSSVRSVSSKYPIYCDESVMSQKEHGTCTQPLMKNLRWGVDWSTADKICCFNRHFAEYSGYFTTTQFMNEKHDSPITFYDPIGGKPLFIAPQGRTWRNSCASRRITAGLRFASRRLSGIMCEVCE